MNQFILIFLLLLPFGIVAQTNAETKESHQKADAKIQELYPDAQKIDLEKLNSMQKEEHKDCKTCGKNKKNNKVTKIDHPEKNISQLKEEENRLIEIIKKTYENTPSEKELILKYKKALQLNQQEIRQLESENARQTKVQYTQK